MNHVVKVYVHYWPVPVAPEDPSCRNNSVHIAPASSTAGTSAKPTLLPCASNPIKGSRERAGGAKYQFIPPAEGSGSCSVEKNPEPRLRSGPRRPPKTSSIAAGRVLSFESASASGAASSGRLTSGREPMPRLKGCWSRLSYALIAAAFKRERTG